VPLITSHYLKEQRRMHFNGRYGAASKKFAHHVIDLVKERNPRSILDYGAGKRALKPCLDGLLEGVRFKEYDPAIEEIARIPDGVFDMVCCIDVLEHIEPECIDSVLSSIRDKTAGFAFMTIHTGPAGKILSDGRNAHLIQQPMDWWKRKLSMFKIERKWMQDNTALVVCK
jgi:hypothetical protein